MKTLNYPRITNNSVSTYILFQCFYSLLCLDAGPSPYVKRLKSYMALEKVGPFGWNRKSHQVTLLHLPPYCSQCPRMHKREAMVASREMVASSQPEIGSSSRTKLTKRLMLNF